MPVYDVEDIIYATIEAAGRRGLDLRGRLAEGDRIVSMLDPGSTSEEDYCRLDAATNRAAENYGGIE